MRKSTSHSSPPPLNGWYQRPPPRHWSGRVAFLWGLCSFLWKFEILWGLWVGEVGYGGVSIELGRTGGLCTRGGFGEVGNSARWMLGVWSCSPEASVKALRICRTERVLSWLDCQASLGYVGAPRHPVFLKHSVGSAG